MACGCMTLQLHALVVRPTPAFTGLYHRQKSATGRSTSVLAASSTETAPSSPRTTQTVGVLSEWANTNGIKYGGVEVTPMGGGLGLVATQDLKAKDVVIEVPSDLTLTVQTPRDSNRAVEDLFDDRGKSYCNSPHWWAQLSIQLNALDGNLISHGKNADVQMRPWLDSLPRQFDTPLHWSDSALAELQYTHLTDAVQAQTTLWTSLWEEMRRNAKPELANLLNYDNFVWGCESARSRAFSGAYSGTAFSPAPYAFTLVLVGAYIALGMGTLEQAANGAAVVVCGAILRDFVVPKFLKQRRYVICPFIDMANHESTQCRADVAFEYFANGYSLAINDNGSGTPVKSGSELYISYGTRSNDQLLQYYGFVEPNNPHDVYVMPPIRTWDIAALEKACGRTFQDGRLQKLDRAGLLGRTDMNPATSSAAANKAGGVVITRASGMDPAAIQALRALVSTDKEWEEAREAIGNFSEPRSTQNEATARMAIRTALELELASKPTTLEEDERLLQVMTSTKGGLMDASREDQLAVSFRIEKKKLLLEIIAGLK
eukprot:CAMPEP_0198294790 /NCGR_PEP_ID=MMETSP1449-20131203/24387_1 /TAXON_ID=420275 /ORGANISM="Attheya septentrionalis, Strain CCMP2084" /LENGTH=544 /DNA_ID=CAMNT_0043994863 /DNA_START=94 /DNA_END=1728 /DNA_ORIENTATION=-